MSSCVQICLLILYSSYVWNPEFHDLFFSQFSRLVFGQAFQSQHISYLWKCLLLPFSLVSWTYSIICLGIGQICIWTFYFIILFTLAEVVFVYQTFTDSVWYTKMAESVCTISSSSVCKRNSLNIWLFVSLQNLVYVKWNVILHHLLVVTRTTQNIHN